VPDRKLVYETTCLGIVAYTAQLTTRGGGVEWVRYVATISQPTRGLWYQARDWPFIKRGSGIRGDENLAADIYGGKFSKGAGG